MKRTLTAAEVVHGSTGPLVRIAWEEQTDANCTLATGSVYLPRDVAEVAAQKLFGGVEVEIETVTTRFYRVREGDTLSGIAARFGLDLPRLADANEIRDLDFIRVGQRLRIPETRR